MIWSKTAVQAVIVLAALAALALGGDRALAADECGPPEPGVEVVCTPENYDAGEDGNIYYAEEAPDGDFSLRLDEGLAVTYDHDDPDDDVLVSELVPGGRYHYSAVVAVPLEPASMGDITLTSSADVTATGYAARGYLVGRTGGSGEVALDLRGGSISTDGESAVGIAAFHHGRGDIAAALRGTTIRGQGKFSDGVLFRHTGNGDIALDADGATVEVIGDSVRGIFTDHIGTGDSLVTLRGGSVSVNGDKAKGLFGYRTGEGGSAFALRDAAVTASGNSAMGVHLFHGGLGDLTIDAERVGIDVTGALGRGVQVERAGMGDILATLRGGALAASGDASIALLLEHYGFGDIAIDIDDGARANATGTFSAGVRAVHRNEGDVTADLRDATVAAHGDRVAAFLLGHFWNGGVRVDAERTGFRAEGTSARAINVFQVGAGDIDIDLRAGSTVTAVGDGRDVDGVSAYQAGAGDVNISAEGSSISVAGPISASAVYVQYFSGAEGDVVVDLSDVAVTAVGDESSGVRIAHWGTRGNLSVRLRDTQITAAGEDSGGVVAGLFSGNGSIRIGIDGGAVVAEGDGAVGVQVGFHSPETDAPTFVADVGADGFRDQTVTVNGRVQGGSGDGAGIWLADGGRVEIGPGGSVGADSGVGIRAAGEGAALHVSADLEGRSPGEVFHGDIRNDAGRTTIVVDGVTLHDPMRGATGALIPRGARDLTLVPGYTVLGRAFSAADFVEPLAPRAAVYETLPDLLFRLAAPSGRSLAARAPGGYAGLEYGEGSIEAAHTTTGAAYDLRRSAAVMTLSGSLGPRFRGWIELHDGEGAAEVASPTGAGTLDAAFRGYRAGAAWHGPHWFASVGLASEDYLLDFATARRGLLDAGVGAQGRSLGIELGRRISTREGTAIIPRAWFTKAGVSAEGFVDAVNAAVSLPDSERSMGGIGLEAQFTREFNGEGALTFGGFADIETMSGDSRTTVLVAGEPLTFQAPTKSLSAGLSVNYRRGRFSIDAAVFTRATRDTATAEHGARLVAGGLF